MESRKSETYTYLLLSPCPFRYDEILEVYRRNLYSLRRLILTGDHQQRRQVLHLFAQQWVDQAVARFIDPSQPPRTWLTESLDPAMAYAGG